MTPDMKHVLRSIALIGAIIRPLIVGVLLVGVWIGLGRAGRKGARRLVPWSVIALIVVAWVSGVWTLAAEGVFASTGAGLAAAGTHVLLPTILIVVGALIFLMRSKTVAELVDAAPLWWLLGFQAYRITGFLFLQLWASGYVPGYFGLPAGIGDMLTAVFAIGAAVALRRQFLWARRFAYAVNIFGLADLVIAVSMGMLTAARSPAGMSPILVYPLSLVPTFGVPLAFIIHCLSLWQMKRRVEADGKYQGQLLRPSQA